MVTLASIFVLLLAYLIGSIPVGVLVGKAVRFRSSRGWLGQHRHDQCRPGRRQGRGRADLCR